MNRHPRLLYCTLVGLSEATTGSVYKKSIYRKTPVLGSLFNNVVGLQVFPVDIAKYFRLAIYNICKWLLLECFNGSLLHGPKV